MAREEVGSQSGVTRTVVWIARRGHHCDVLIATKVGSDMGLGYRCLRRDYILEEVEQSLRRLQVDCIDLYQSHWDDDKTPFDETLEAYDRLIRAGKVKVIGASNLNAARLAADICGVPTVVVARTDAESAMLITSDIDERDREFLSGERTAEGFYCLKPGTGFAHCIKRGMAFARYADMLWWETSKPDLAGARRFADAIHREFPGKLLAYNCSPSFHWKMKLSEGEIARFQEELAVMGYKFQFVTLAGFHALNYSMFKLAHGYKDRGMAAYSELQEAEFEMEKDGYSATKHQREVGTGYFDEVSQVIASGECSTTALSGPSTKTKNSPGPAPSASAKKRRPNCSSGWRSTRGR